MPGFFHYLSVYPSVLSSTSFHEKKFEMKTVAIIIIGMLTAAIVDAQDTNEVNIRHLGYHNIDLFNRLDMDVRNYSFQDPHINQRLSDIVSCQHKSNDHGGIGLVMAIIGASIITIAAIGADPEPVNPPSGAGLDIEFDFGPAFAIVGGSLIAGGSVPFLLAGAKNKRKMKAAIRETKLLLMQ